MIEHPVVLSQSYFDIVLKYRKIPPNDLLAKTEYQLAKVSSSVTQPSDPFASNPPIQTKTTEPLHTVSISNLDVSTHHYFRARFVTMKGYVSPWSETYLLKTGEYILKTPVILDPVSGMNDIGSSLVLKLDAIHNHPYFKKIAYANLEIYKIKPGSSDYKYVSTIKLDPSEVLTGTDGKPYNKGAIDNSLINVSNKFASNSSYLVKLKYGYQVAEGSSLTYGSDFSEDFYFKTKPFFIERAKIVVEQVIVAQVNNNTTTTETPPPPPDETTPPPDETTPPPTGDIGGL